MGRAGGFGVEFTIARQPAQMTSQKSSSPKKIGSTQDNKRTTFLE